MRFPLAVTATLAAACSLLSQSTVSANPIDSELPGYRPSDNIAGQVSLVGSSTMSNVAGIWTDSFQHYHPQTKLPIAAPGSRAAVDAVINGQATFGLLSRSITQDEAARFNKTFGYNPTVLDCCYEHIAIYVHEKNTIPSLTLEQVRDIFSGKATKWGDVGATGQWASQPIITHGRGSTTGSRVFMQQTLLRGTKHVVTQEHESNRDLVSAVGSMKEARGIGYAGLIYKLPGVRAVPIAHNKDTAPVAIDSLAAARGGYAIMRPLQLVVNQPPNKRLPAEAAEFLKYVFSHSGQEDVVKSGFQPISAAPARMALDATGLGTAR